MGLAKILSYVYLAGAVYGLVTSQIGLAAVCFLSYFLFDMRADLDELQKKLKPIEKAKDVTD